jgi:hypothetical protein
MAEDLMVDVAECLGIAKAGCCSVGDDVWIECDGASAAGECAVVMWWGFVCFVRVCESSGM